jgi:putative spermidine/putrescine transport system ATP-binding protein
MGVAVAFAGVRKTYGSTVALEAFDLALDPGEVVTLLGPSGSGKSTALHILAGFVEPSAGDVFIGGQQATTIPTERRNLSMVFQNYALFPHLSVRDNVAFPLRMRGVQRATSRDRAEAALALVRMEGFGDRKPSELSGGQRQRAALARALVTEPPLLLMDEPLGALDLKLREALADEIRSLQRRIGCTVLLVTHDQTEAFALSDRVAVMRAGRIEQVGTPSDIFDRPRTRFVAEFVGEANLLEAQAVGEGLAVRGLTTIPLQLGLRSHWRGQVVLRPGQLRLLEATDAADVRFEAQIIDVGFRGERVRLEISLASGQRLVMTVSHRVGQPLPPAGASVSVGFDIASLALVNSDNLPLPES